MTESRLPDFQGRIRAHIASSLGIDEASLRDDEILLSGLLDSIDLLTLTTHIEGTYGVTIAAHEVNPENFGTLNALAAFVARKTSAS